MAKQITDLKTPYEDLISKARRGDQAAFYQIYEGFSGFAYAIFRRHLGNSPDVEDLMQQVFVKVYLELSEYRGDRPFRAWLRRACHFAIYDYLRASKRVDDPVEDDRLEEANRDSAETSEPPNPEVSFVKAEIRHHTRRIMNTMTAEKRMALFMHDFEGHTLLEISKILGCSMFTVKTRLVRARREFTAKAKKDTGLRQLLNRSVA